MTATSAAATGAAATMREPRPWRRAAAWLCVLAVFFYSTYGAANWLAARRADVPSIVFAWERSIPFLDWTIIPYWSVNLFYGLSVFVCSTRQELDVHVRRLLTAQVVAVLCFMLFPLRFTFAQPETQGFSGFLFAALTSFDQPFNQAPSLHIALLVILWVLYARHAPRWGLWLLHPWFVLVGASVLTTYQHHFIDIPTGILLGCVCLWLWPDHGPSPAAAATLARDRRRLVLAVRYTLGALVFAVVALAVGHAALWLLWPAVSLGLVAGNYAFFGARGFQKGPDGRMSLAAWLLLAPYLAGAWINSRAWTYSRPGADVIRPGVALGRMPGARDTRSFATVVDLCAELPGTQQGVAWRSFPLLDLVPPDPQALRAAAAAIEDARRTGSVLVCCALGYSRSACAVAVWLVCQREAAGIADAVAQIRRARPHVVLNDAAVAAIAKAVERDS